MNGNHLLYWMSARRSGSWLQFRSAVEELHLQEELAPVSASVDEGGSGFPLYWELRFHLQRLGHVDFCDERWHVAPAVLAANQECGAYRGILCGARLPTLLDRLKAACGACGLDEKAQLGAPNLVSVSCESLEQLKRIAEEAGVRLQPDSPRAMLAVLPPVDDPRCQRPCDLPEGDGWTVKRFSISGLSWAESTPAEARRARYGLFKFEHKYQKHYLFCRKGRASRINAQVGKFAVLKAGRRRKGILTYDAAGKCLSIPLMCHPPPVLYRALTLCSGVLPAVAGGSLRFTNVAEDVASYAAELLRQEIS